MTFMDCFNETIAALAPVYVYKCRVRTQISDLDGQFLIIHRVHTQDNCIWDSKKGWRGVNALGEEVTRTS
jgi:hypothetical protein